MNALPSFAFPGGFDAGERSGSETGPQDGFVDEAALHRLLADAAKEEPARVPRRTAVREECILATDDADYAGWQAAPAGRPADPVFVVPASCRNRRASAEGGRRQPHPPGVSAVRSAAAEGDAVRWWLAIVVGALIALVVALVLLAVASRHPLFSPTERIAIPPESPPSAESQAHPHESAAQSLTGPQMSAIRR
jgi:hypothetical protein